MAVAFKEFPGFGAGAAFGGANVLATHTLGLCYLTMCLAEVDLESLQSIEEANVTFLE